MPSQLSKPKNIWIRSANAKAKVINRKAIIINLEKGNYYQLNGVATRIWEMLDGKNSLSQIVEKISKEFDAEKKQVEKDALQLIADLQKEGLIE